MKNNSFEELHWKITKQINKAIKEYTLIEDGDTILVGLSGGKDSMCLLEFLSERSKISRPSFKIIALHVRMSNIKYETDTDYLKNFCKDNNVELLIKTTDFTQNKDSKKPMCFLCSWHRRKVLFETAQQLNCNKIALGHHMDDIIHTTIMNLFYQGQFSTMPAKLSMKKMPITIIRPLCLVAEESIKQYSSIKAYKPLVKSCPFETESVRSKIKEVFMSVEAHNPEARYSIWNALEKENKLIE